MLFRRRLEHKFKVQQLHIFTGLIVSKSKPARRYSFTGNFMIGLKLSRTKGRWTTFSDEADSGD